MGEKWFNLLQACVIVGGLVWYAAVSTTNAKNVREDLAAVLNNQQLQTNVHSHLTTLIQDNRVGVLVSTKDIASNTYRIERLEERSKD